MQQSHHKSNGESHESQKVLDSIATVSNHLSEKL